MHIAKTPLLTLAALGFITQAALLHAENPPPATTSAPATSPDEPALVPNHQPADLKHGLWWLDRAQAEAGPAAPAIELHRAILLARKKDAAAAQVALAKVQAFIDETAAQQSPNTPATQSKPRTSRLQIELDRTRARITAILEGKEQRPELMKSRAPTSQPANPYAAAATLHKHGDLKAYEIQRTPHITAVKDAKDPRALQSATLNLLIFDLETSNFESAIADADTLQLEDKGWAMLLMQLIAEAMHRSDMPLARAVGTIAARRMKMNMPLVLLPVIDIQVANNELEEMLKWIQALPTAPLRAEAYMKAADSLIDP